MEVLTDKVHSQQETVSLADKVHTQRETGEGGKEGEKLGGGLERYQ